MSRLRRLTGAVQWLVWVGAATAFVLLFSLGEAPEPAAEGADAEFDDLVASGAVVYDQRCAGCHGDQGQGGQGPRLADTVVVNFPDATEQFALVADGRGAMPGFADTLTAEEIAAVVTFTRFGWS